MKGVLPALGLVCRMVTVHIAACPFDRRSVDNGTLRDRSLAVGVALFLGRSLAVEDIATTDRNLAVGVATTDRNLAVGVAATDRSLVAGA